MRTLWSEPLSPIASYCSWIPINFLFPYFERYGWQLVTVVRDCHATKALPSAAAFISGSTLPLLAWISFLALAHALFPTHTGRKCILFSQEVAEIVLLGLGSHLQKCCCYKKIFLQCFSFPSGDNTFFSLFPVSKDVCLTFLHSHGETMKSLFFRLLVGPGCAAIRF